MEENGVAGKGAAFCTTLLSQRRSDLMFGQPDHNPETEGGGVGVMHISRANDKLKSGNAACRACVPCMEGLLGKQVRDVYPETSSLRFSRGLALWAFPVSCCPCSSWPRVS